MVILGQQDEIEVEEVLVDAAAYRMARQPESFDVVVTTNLFGDVLSDLASAFGEGLGGATSVNYGETKGMFEPVYGSAPDIAGLGIANPLATLRASVLLLNHLGQNEVAQRLGTALETLSQSNLRTPDQGDEARTEDIFAAVGNAL